jgi:hypothetical protein
VAGSLRRVHNEKLHNLHISTNIYADHIKQNYMGGNVESMEGMRNEHKLLVKNLKGTEHWEDLVVGRRIILEGILEKHVGKFGTGSIWLRIGTNGWLL